MSYRRKRDDIPFGKTWLSNNVHALLACGVPIEIVKSYDTWCEVLLHGGDFFGTGWEPSWITPAQAQALLDLLTPFDDENSEFIRELRKRIQPTCPKRR